MPLISLSTRRKFTHQCGRLKCLFVEEKLHLYNEMLKYMFVYIYMNCLSFCHTRSQGQKAKMIRVEKSLLVLQSK